MSSVDAPNWAVYRACIVWDVPSLRNLERDDAQRFLDAMRLHPSRGAAEEGLPARMSPVRRAAEGLTAELCGQTDEARAHYRIVAKYPGIRGLLGSCLLAWMNEATPADFSRTVRRLSTITGPGSRDLTARVHCKLAEWAMDHGWADLAVKHYDAAVQLSEGALRRALQGIGDWFGREQVLYFETAGENGTIGYPWIQDRLHYAALDSLENRLKASIKSPWTRTWTFGGAGIVEGLDITAAELQASWAGALWLMPEIRRAHAAMVLERSQQPSDVARAIGLWVRGGGGAVRQLVEVHEGHLSEESVSELVETQLGRGASVYRRGAWLEICQTLWDELPDTLVQDILGRYRPPEEDITLYSEAAKELELFAFLLCREPEELSRVESYSPPHRALVARLLPRPLLPDLEPKAMESLLSAALEPGVKLDDSWESTGWLNLAPMWSRLPRSDREAWRHRLLQLLPPASIPEVAAARLGLLHESDIENSIASYSQTVWEEAEKARRGHFTGWSTSPMINLARLLLGLGRPVADAIDALVSVAVSRYTSSEQRYLALTALRALAEDGLVTAEQAAATFENVSVNAVRTDDRAGDQRLEDMARTALKSRVAFTSRINGVLLAGGRDRDARVREVAIGSVAWLSLRGVEPTAARDAALLGALYDPNPCVQATAVPAIWQGHFVDNNLQAVSLHRLVEAWPESHRRVRIVVAGQLRARRRHRQIRQQLITLAASDRSWQVRHAANGKREIG
jgi:hypothetical protein